MAEGYDWIYTGSSCEHHFFLIIAIENPVARPLGLLLR